MSYITKTLVPGEKVIYETRLHWIVMLGHVVSALVLLVLGGLLFYYVWKHPEMQPDTKRIMDWGAGILVLFGIIVFLLGSVRRNATEMAVTTRRVVIKTGVASRRTIEMLLNKVETIEVSEPGMGRMLGYGSIVVVGTGGTSEPFHKMNHPLEFRSQVQQQIEKLPPHVSGEIPAAEPRPRDVS